MEPRQHTARSLNASGHGWSLSLLAHGLRTAAFWLSLGLIFAIPFENLSDVGGIGTVSRAIGLLLAVVWATSMLVTGRIRRPALFHGAVCAFIVWNTVSILWSLDVPETREHLITYVQLFMMIVILWDLYTTFDALRAGLQAYVCGALISVGSTVVNYVKGDMQNNYNAFSATGFNTDGLAAIFALGLPVAIYLALSPSETESWPIARLISYAYIPAGFLGLALTGNRAALIATLPALLFGIWAVVRQRPAVQVTVFLFLVVAAFVVVPLVPDTSFERLRTIGAEISEGDLNGRVMIWHAGFDMFWERPLLGVGCGAFRTAVGMNKVAHNVFLSVLVELGVIGFAIFAVILGSASFAALRQTKWKMYFWMSVLVVWAIASSALPLDQKKTTWLFLALAVASASAPTRGTG